VVPKVYPIKYNKKCNIPVWFNGATGAIAEIRSNNLVMCFIGTTANICSLNYTSRIRFIS